MAQLLRFFSHLILFYRLITPTSAEPLPPLPEDVSSSIIEGYVDVLQQHEKPPSLIAFYCTALDVEHAVDVYSRYLHQQFTTSSLDGPSDEHTDRLRRHEALHAAASNGLDMASIAKRVTEVTVEDISVELPDFSAAQASFGLDALVSSSQASDKEVDLIRSVEWLTFDPSTHPEALVHANALIRYFLSKPAAPKSYPGDTDFHLHQVRDRLPSLAEFWRRFPLPSLPNLLMNKGSRSILQVKSASIWIIPLSSMHSASIYNLPKCGADVLQ